MTRTARVEWFNGKNGDTGVVYLTEQNAVGVLTISAGDMLEERPAGEFDEMRVCIAFAESDFYVFASAGTAAALNESSLLFSQRFARQPEQSLMRCAIMPLAHEDTVVIDDWRLHFFEPGDSPGEQYIPYTGKESQVYASQPLLVSDIKSILMVAVFQMIHRPDLILSIAGKLSRLCQRPMPIYPFSNESGADVQKSYEWKGLSANYRDAQEWLPKMAPTSVPEVQPLERLAIDRDFFTYRERAYLHDAGTLCYLEGRFLDGTRGYQYAYILAEEFEPIYEKLAMGLTPSVTDYHYATAFVTGRGKPSMQTRQQFTRDYQVSRNHTFTVVVVA